uniref:Uncharacterized protein n=1 Tax=Arundo donax TaxID=35708 RepID=A0A0A8YBK4_ARUDO
MRQALKALRRCFFGSLWLTLRRAGSSTGGGCSRSSGGLQHVGESW